MSGHVTDLLRASARRQYPLETAFKNAAREARHVAPPTRVRAAEPPSGHVGAGAVARVSVRDGLLQHRTGEALPGGQCDLLVTFMEPKARDLRRIQAFLGHAEVSGW
jgi:hypothetical protein